MGSFFTMEQTDRQRHIDVIKSYHYSDDINFFNRYIAGEDFDKQKLIESGYTIWAAQNIAAYLQNPDNVDLLNWK
jgi:hypothetical protein